MRVAASVAMLRALLAIGVGSCSFAWHDAYRREPPASVAECPSRARAVVDTVGAVALAMLAGEAFASRDEADSAAGIFVLPIASGAVAFAGSAIYGFIEPGLCERRFAELQRREREVEREVEQRAEADRAVASRARTREQAWTRMRDAADAARRDDCASVRSISDDVRALDADFHATVFVRDVAIARCLAR